MTNAKELLNTKPTDIDVSGVQQYRGLFQSKCKICTSDYLDHINIMLTQHIPHKQIVEWANKNNLFGDKPLNTTNVHLHANNHLSVTKALVKQSDRAISKSAKKKQLQEVRQDLMVKTDEVISAEVLRMSVEPFYTGDKTPQLREAVSLVKAVSDKKQDEAQANFFAQMVEAAKKPVNVKKGDKVKTKMKVSVGGVELSEQIESEV